MTIEEIQKEISDLGYQWREHIFNDGLGAECLLKISRSRNPMDIADDRDNVGWGRYRREYCWIEALKYARNENKKA